MVVGCHGAEGCALTVPPSAFSCVGTHEVAVILPLCSKSLPFQPKSLPLQSLAVGVGGAVRGAGGWSGGCRGFGQDGCRGAIANAGKGGQQARPAAEHLALTLAVGINFFCSITHVVRVFPAWMCSSILLRALPGESRSLGCEHQHLGMGLLCADHRQVSSCPPCLERAFNSGSLSVEINLSFLK